MIISIFKSSHTIVSCHEVILLITQVVFTMLVVVLLLFLLRQSSGDVVRYRCSDNVVTPVTFTRATDGIEGRYTVELCMLKNPNITNWMIDLWYFSKGGKCRKRPDVSHSKIKNDIEHNNNCTNVCYSADFDLIYTGLYNIHSEFEVIGGSKLRSTDTCVKIDNNLTRHYYENNKVHVECTPREDDVTLHLYLGLPVTYYEVDLSPKKDNKTTEYFDRTEKVTQNCTIVKWNEVICRLFLPDGCYHLNFQHNAPWAAVLNDQTSPYYNFCKAAPKTPVLSGSTSHALWICGGILLACAAVVIILIVQRILKKNEFHKRMLAMWPRQRDIEAPQVLSPSSPYILLLYAREGEHGQRAVSTLKVLLEAVTGGQIVDLYDPEVTATASAAPGAWLRSVLLAPRTRVLLLQSPAAAALCDTRLNTLDLTLQAPLLGRRAMYRCPHVGDNLLLLALRVLSETVSAHQDYRKYYVATYSTLETDIIKQLVPYRRYVLPGAVQTLAVDLRAHPHSAQCAQTPPDELLHKYEEAATAFIAHVTENPDYLLDELMIM